MVIQEKNMKLMNLLGLFFMPESKFIEIVNNSTNNEKSCIINKVSRYFNVSNQAVISRGKFLGIFS